MIGRGTNVGANNLTNATAVGSGAFVTQSNSLILGSINGVNSSTADTKVGIGVTAPSFKLHVVDPSNQGLRVQTNSVGGTVAAFGGFGEFQIDAPGIAGGRLLVKENGNVGIGTTSPVNERLVVGGMIQTFDGIKFSDSTVQTTAVGGAYTAISNTSFEISPVDAPVSEIIHLDVPPGIYLIEATIEFVDTSAVPLENNTRKVVCVLAGDDWRFDMLGPNTAAYPPIYNWTNIENLHSVKIYNTFPTTRIYLDCGALNGWTDRSKVFAVKRRLSAIRLGSVAVQ